MPATKYNIVVEEGSVFELSLVWRDADGDPINLTGYTARMQARETKDATATLFSLTSAAGDITLGGAAGTIVARIGANVTVDYTFTKGFYDLEMLLGGIEADAIRLIEGRVKLTREVTR